MIYWNCVYIPGLLTGLVNHLNLIFHLLLLLCLRTLCNTHQLRPLPLRHTNLTLVGGSAVLRLLVGRHTALYLKEEDGHTGESNIL